MAAPAANAEQDAASVSQREAKSRVATNYGFQYKKKFMDKDLQAEWDKLNAQKDGTKNALKREFINEAMALPGNSFDSPFFNKFRKIDEVSESGSGWAWVSWKKFCDDEGEEVAMEMITSGNVESRPHKGLKPDTKLKYPMTHQFRKVTEKGANKTIKTDTQMLRDKEDPEAVAAFGEAWDKTCPVAPKKATKKTVPTEKSDHQKAFEDLAQTHRKWDEHKRIINASIVKAAQNEYVAPKLIEDLKTLKKNALNLDASLCSEDESIKNGKVLGDSDATVVHDVCKELKDMIDHSKKLLKKIDHSCD